MTTGRLTAALSQGGFNKSNTASHLLLNVTGVTHKHLPETKLMTFTPDKTVLSDLKANEIADYVNSASSFIRSLMIFIEADSYWSDRLEKDNVEILDVLSGGHQELLKNIIRSWNETGGKPDVNSEMLKRFGIDTKAHELGIEIQIAGWKYIEYVKERWCEEVADMPMHCIDYDFDDDAITWAADFYSSIQEIKDEMLATA